MSENITTSTILQRIERGTAWLDEVKPEWRDEISRATLDLAYPSTCVLGQAFATEAHDYDWDDGFEYVYSSGYYKGAAGESLSARWMVDHGFDRSAESYDVLTIAWLQHLRPQER